MSFIFDDIQSLILTSKLLKKERKISIVDTCLLSSSPQWSDGYMFLSLLPHRWISLIAKRTHSVWCIVVNDWRREIRKLITCWNDKKIKLQRCWYAKIKKIKKILNQFFCYLIFVKTFDHTHGMLLIFTKINLVRHKTTTVDVV